MRSFISVLASLLFLLSANLAAQIRPFERDGKLILETALPDANGVSQNEFSSFDLRGPVEFQLDPATKNVIIRVKDGTGFNIVDSYNIQVKRPAGKDRVLLTIEHPLSIMLQNSSFLDTDVQLVSSQVKFVGLGANATNALTVKSFHIAVNAPIIANQLDLL